MKNFIVLLILFSFIFRIHSSNANDDNNIIVQCEKQNFQCKGYFQNRVFDINIGKNGLIDKEKKREGDLSTPIGDFRLKNIVFYKVIKPESKLKKMKIQESYKWCDDSNSKIYNRFFILNEKTEKICSSYENLFREDDVYDFVIPINYNMDNPVPYEGSAIFIHLRRSENVGTAGCVAFEKDDLIFVIKNLNKDSRIIIEKL